MKASVCIPTVRTATISHAVAAMLKQTHADWELFVLGQGPDEAGLRGAVESAGNGDSRVRYLHLSRTGLSVARNAGLEMATGDIIAFTDDDCEVAPDWLRVIVDCFASDDEVGLVGGAVRRPLDGPKGWLTTCPTNEPAEARYDPSTASHRAPKGWDWIGANFAIRRSVAARVGPFDEMLGAGTQYPCAEDTDWKFRLEALGVVMLTTPRSVVDHTYGARSGLRAGFRHSRNYARGNAALAAKLTLQGDPFGEIWRSQAMRGTRHEWSRDALPHRLPVALSRKWHFRKAYREVIDSQTIGPDGVLAPRVSPTPPSK